MDWEKCEDEMKQQAKKKKTVPQLSVLRQNSQDISPDLMNVAETRFGFPLYKIMADPKELFLSLNNPLHNPF